MDPRLCGYNISAWAPDRLENTKIRRFLRECGGKFWRGRPADGRKARSLRYMRAFSRLRIKADASKKLYKYVEIFVII